MGKFKEKIKRWYDGKPLNPKERLANEIAVQSGHPPRNKPKRHWTAYIARWAVKEYKWIVGVILTALSVGIAAYLALK